jgi:hypothetical protein
MPNAAQSRFVAFSNFASVFVETLKFSNTSTVGQLRAGINDVCATNWTALNQVLLFSACIVKPQYMRFIFCVRVLCLCVLFVSSFVTLLYFV